MKKEKTIVLADASSIILQGLKSMLAMSADSFKLQLVSTPGDLEICLKTCAPDLVILNPGFLPEHQPDKLWRFFDTPDTTLFVCILYSYFDDKIIKLFDEVIYINDSNKEIVSKVGSLLQKTRKAGFTNQDVHLSRREVEVLKYLVTGLTNKEISERLFISTHTVVSHRKNITTKLGIKSVAGLTIYAVLNKIISEEEIQDYFDTHLLG